MFRKNKQGTRHKRPSRKLGVNEIVDLVKNYARQELLEPLVGVPRWVALGLIGSVGLMIGGVLLLLALLRALQTETGCTFCGNLSWIPYTIVAGVLLVAIALLLRKINKKELS